MCILFCMNFFLKQKWIIFKCLPMLNVLTKVIKTKFQSYTGKCVKHICIENILIMCLSYESGISKKKILLFIKND